MNWEVSARSETGYVRDENQDHMSGVRVGLGRLYIVADGMGGHKGGKLAAELTVAGLQQSLIDASPQAPVTEAIRRAFEQANATVYERAHAGDPTTEGMGSAVVLLLAVETVAYIAHVGDSRAYLYRHGRLQPLTIDHTRVQRMVEAGMLTPAEVREHPEASLLERAIGQKPGIEVDIGPGLPLQEGDGILLCSDGLSGYVDDQAIEAVLRGTATVQAVADRLVQLTLAQGGQDNVTVQFIQYGKWTEMQPMKTANNKFSHSMDVANKPLLTSRIAAAACLGLLVLAIGAAVHFYTQYRELAENRADLQTSTEVTTDLDRAKGTIENLEKELDKTMKAMEATNKTIDELNKELGLLKGEIVNLNKKLDKRR